MRSLVGHKKDVRAVAYTPDGRVLSGGADGTVRLWDAFSGECTAVMKAKGPVYAVAASPNGTRLAYGGRYAPGSESSVVYLCDTAGKTTGSFAQRFERGTIERTPGGWHFETVNVPDPRSVWSLSFSADRRYLAMACRVPGGANIPNGGGGTCWLLNAPPTEPNPSLPDDTYALAFAPTGHRLAVTRRSAVRFFEPGAEGQVEYPTTAEWSAAVAFVPGNDLAVVASSSYLYFVNPVKQEKKPRRVKTGLRVVTGVAAAPHGRTVLAGGKPGTVEVYDTAAGTRTTSFDFGVGGVHGLAIAPDGLTFAVAGDQGLVVCDMPE